jgi:hypothetical protein
MWPPQFRYLIQYVEFVLEPNKEYPIIWDFGRNNINEPKVKPIRYIRKHLRYMKKRPSFKH